MTTGPAEDTLAIFQQHLEVGTPFCEQSGWIQLPRSTVERLTNAG
jgi:hypothetical protein